MLVSIFSLTRTRRSSLINSFIYLFIYLLFIWNSAAAEQHRKFYSAVRFFLAPASCIAPAKAFSVSRVVSLVVGETRDEETLFGLT